MGGKRMSRFGVPVLDAHKGYLRMKQKGGTYQSMSRLIWTELKGLIPKSLHVDHINSNKLDNRIENLQLVTNKQNTQRYAKGNVHERNGKYRATRVIDGKRFTATFGTKSGAIMFNNTRSK